jgi:hypothetical protein
MSYEADLAQVAESLAQLLATGDPPRSDELPAVNAARLGLRRLCAQVLGDVAPVLPVRVGDGRPGIADLARSPVSTLRGLLAKDPPELIAAEGDRPANDGGAPSAWRTLWAATALAADDWSRAELASRPTGAEAWSAVADIVAVAEAAALVDRDLVDPRRGRFRVRRSDDSWRVGIAAAEVRRLACTGSLPPAEPLRPDGKNLLPLRVRSLAELPAALTRLAHLVRVAGHLRPESVGALAGAHARTLALMAKVMEGGIASGGTHGVMPGLSDALRTHAVALVNVRGAVRRVRSISSDDPRPARWRRSAPRFWRSVIDSVAVGPNRRGAHSRKRPVPPSPSDRQCVTLLSGRCPSASGTPGEMDMAGSSGRPRGPAPSRGPSTRCAQPRRTRRGC